MEKKQQFSCEEQKQERFKCYGFRALELRGAVSRLKNQRAWGRWSLVTLCLMGLSFGASACGRFGYPDDPAANMPPPPVPERLLSPALDMPSSQLQRPTSTPNLDTPTDDAVTRDNSIKPQLKLPKEKETKEEAKLAASGTMP